MLLGVLVKVGELSAKLAGPALADVREGDLDLIGLVASRVREGLFLSQSVITR
jgi:hypothetical protein